MKTTVSSKYQVVIPKAIRRKMGIVPGQTIEFGQVHGNKVTITKGLQADEYFKRYAGTLNTADTPWGERGIDPTVWLRRQRDED